MYVPPHNRNEDRAALLAFMREHSFATLVTAAEGLPNATHLPFLEEEDAAGMVLNAHLARTNPQARELVDGVAALVIFQGPHAYVSPRHYQRHPSVPTWNYAAVHAGGSLRRLDARTQKLELLERLIAAHDHPYLERFRGLSPEFLQVKLDGIVAFELRVTSLQARWKLSQDRSPEERAAVISALEFSDDAAARATAALMRRQESTA